MKNLNLEIIVTDVDSGQVLSRGSSLSFAGAHGELRVMEEFTDRVHKCPTCGYCDKMSCDNCSWCGTASEETSKEDA